MTTLTEAVPRGTTNTLLVTALGNWPSAIGDPRDTVKITTTVMTTSAIALGGTYTTDEDFEKGTLNGLTNTLDHLELGTEMLAFPFIWVPNTDTGTISLVDTRSGKEIGRYRTGPGTTNSPSRTTVDLRGNCWVANRVTGTVIKIAHPESGDAIDRNGNGRIDTSSDLNGDGDITGSELLPWGQDEAVLAEVVVIPGREGTFLPGTYTGGYTDDWTTPGPRGIALDRNNNVWIGTYGTRKFRYVDGSTGQILRTVDFNSAGIGSYGAVLDDNGILWSASLASSNVLRYDTLTHAFYTVALPQQVYGLGLDRANRLFTSGWESARLSRLNVTNSVREWTVNAIFQSRGVAVTADGDVWVANSASNTVTRWSNDGAIKRHITVGITPTGVAVDHAGKVWSVGLGDEEIQRIDPNTDTVDLRKRLSGAGGHYGYSDMTGVLVRNTTTKSGIWKVTHNSKVEFTPWSAVTWHGTNLVVTNIVGSVTNVFTNLTVRVRSSHNQQQWSNWETAQNGYPLTATPAGQWLELEVTLQQFTPDASPILYDISVAPVLQGSADLVVTQTILPNPVTQWLPATNWITVSNLGPDQATGVVLSNGLPAGVEFVSATASQGTATLLGGAVRAVLGTIPAGSNARVAVVFIPTNTAPLASVASVKAYDFDPQPQGNVVVGSTAVAPLTCAPVMDGLVAWWPGEGSGMDLAGANNAALQNGVAFGAGKVGSAFAFDGANDYADLGNWFNLQTFTISLWVRPSGSQVTYADIIDNNHTDTRSWVMQYQNLTGAGATFWGFGLRMQGYAGVGFWLTNGVWQHVVATLDQSRTVNVYVDGVLVGTSSGSGSVIYDGSQYLRLSRWGGGGRYFNGSLDEVRIFNRALSEAEVRAIYQAGSGGVCRTPFLPVLTIQPVAGAAVLSWTANAPWTAQFTTQLFPVTPWQPVPGTPFTLTNRYWLTNPITAPQRYYRLTR